MFCLNVARLGRLLSLDAGNDRRLVFQNKTYKCALCPMVCAKFNETECVVPGENKGEHLKMTNSNKKKVNTMRRSVLRKFMRIPRFVKQNRFFLRAENNQY